MFVITPIKDGEHHSKNFDIVQELKDKIVERF